MHDIPANPIRLALRPQRARRSPTEGFVYLACLPKQEFNRLFASLFLPADEWRSRLGADVFDALPELPVYIDPLTRKPCHLGEDIRVAMRARHLASMLAE